MAHWASIRPFSATGGGRIPLPGPSQGDRATRQAARRAARSPGAAFGAAVSDAALAMLTVGGCIALGTVVSALAQRLLPSMPPSLSAALHALLEMAGGTAELTALRLPPRALLCALAAAPSLGGLSILAQNLAFLSPAKVRAWPLILARLLHAALSALMVFALSG